MRPPSTADDLVNLAAESGLLARERLEPYLAPSGAFRPAGPPAPLARALVRDGLLTSYQSDQLLSGRYKNFFIGGKYKVLEPVGRGGMATVFLCEHKVMRRRVALKFLPETKAKDPSTLARFHREARAVAQLDHPNIATAHDIDHVGRLHFIVMQFVDGVDLERLICRRGPLPHEEAAHYIAQAAEGLQHAHEAGLVHRDVKPANLMLDRSGRVKVLDLGLARFFHDDSDNLTSTCDFRSVLGTAYYLAPEQALDSHTVDIRADIYSLGVTFHFLLTAKGLAEEADGAEALSLLRARKPRPIRDLRPGLPEELLRILDTMLADDPARRFQTPAEVVAALSPWAGPPASAPSARIGSPTLTVAEPDPDPEPVSLGSPAGVSDRRAIPVALPARSRITASPPADPAVAAGLATLVLTAAPAVAPPPRPRANPPHAVRKGRRPRARGQAFVLNLALLMLTITTLAAGVWLATASTTGTVAARTPDWSP